MWRRVDWLHVTDKFPLGLLDPKHVEASILEESDNFLRADKLYRRWIICVTAVGTSDIHYLI
jgi:hypothetical protein